MIIIRAKAPLRISFAGGGTDVPPFPELEGGCVLNATIDSFAWGSLRPRQDGEIHIRSLDLDLSLSYKNGNLALDGQLDLVKMALLKMEAHDSQGFDVFLHSDAPPGSGLGSSSALVVAMVSLVKAFKNVPLTDYEIAELAYVIERKELGIQGGLQDQYASAFGGFNFTEFHKDRVVVNSLRISQGTINELEHNCLLCFTGTTRQSDQIIADQTKRYISHNPESIEGLRRQKELAVEMKNLLLRGELNGFAELLHVAWEAKKRLSLRITTPEIDELYEEARAHGALGGKLLGAGGGGYMLLYCEFEKKHEVAAVIRKMGAIPTDFVFESHGVQHWRVNGVCTQS